MNITINDVADEAGVSITTVSRVLNNNYPVKKETRERIEKAIKKLNYTPNAMARSLITKKTSMIGVIVPGITNLFFPTIVEAIGEFTKKSGYSISLCSTGGDYLVEQNLSDALISRQVDGIITIDPSIECLENGYYSKLSDRTPVIVVNGYPNGYKCNFVCYDEEVGCKEAFDYLIGLGHKKIAFIRGAKSYSYDIKEELYKKLLIDNSFSYEKVVRLKLGNSIEVIEQSKEGVKGILTLEERPTAIFACNDLMAVGAIQACQSLGLSVPEDISIIGFDNTIISDITSPRLTSVDQNMKDIGKRAAIELLDLIENDTKIRKKIIVATNLVIKDSCSKAK
ncbi:MAG: LacI family DNA-binding transcriptional regulator [Clostridiaceae bacterium]|nr:LacI family DNA-binding transcriptional regulator [Clostridiaceae bacterium]